jgi:hypothetical protein
MSPGFCQSTSRLDHGQWTTIDEELPQQARQTTGATKLILMVFFNPKEFAIGTLFPQDASFAAVYFVNDVILPLADRYVQQLGISAVASCIYISTIPSATLLGMSKNRWPPVGASVLPLHLPSIHPIWPSLTSICSGGQNSNSLRGLG